MRKATLLKRGTTLPDSIECCDGADEHHWNGEVYSYECGCYVGSDGDIYDDDCIVKLEEPSERVRP